MHPSLTELKAYLKGGEPKHVGSHIESCERCQTVVEGINNLSEIAQGSDDVEQIISNSAQRVKEDINMRRRPRYSFLKYAAAILFILGSSWLLYEFNFKRSLLDKEIATVYKAPPLLRSSEQVNWSGFQQQYAANNFADAFDQLDQFENTTGQTEFYKGLCKLYQKNPDFLVAINYLQNPLVTKSRYAEQATYFTALAYLKVEEINKAKELLVYISETTNHYKQKEATELLKSY